MGSPLTGCGSALRALLVPSNNSWGYMVEDSCLMSSGKCFLNNQQPFFPKTFLHDILITLQYMVVLGHVSALFP